MRLIYEGKDITRSVEIQKADLIDNAGGVADSLELWFDDPKKLWSKWKPEKNHKVQIRQDGFDSGLMYVDELEQQRGLFIVRALSIPQEEKTSNTKAWENVRFLELAGEIARKYGFTLETYGIQNYLYERVDQFEQADFEFLAYRCMLEGYMIKITNQKVVIYDERYMEEQDSVRTVYLEEFDGRYKFLNTSTGIYSACKVSSGSIKAEFKPSNAPVGSILKSSNLYITSQGEGNRYAKNLLRYHNKHGSRGYCTIKLDVGIGAGNNINIKGIGLADGKYFCQQLIHKFVEKRTYLKLRRPLEGY